MNITHEVDSLLADKADRLLGKIIRGLSPRGTESNPCHKRQLRLDQTWNEEILEKMKLLLSQKRSHEFIVCSCFKEFNSTLFQCARHLALLTEIDLAIHSPEETECKFTMCDGEVHIYR